MDIKELIAQYDDMEAENGMNIQEEVNEAEVKEGSLGDTEVRLNNLMTGGIVVRGNTYNMEGMSQEKQIEFGFVSDMYAKPFKASLDNENDPKELAKECAEILRKHLEPAEQEIVAFLKERGFVCDEPNTEE